MEGRRQDVLLWICVFVLDGVVGTCPAGQYGSRCSYTCHCPLVSCNTTSGCQPAHCSKGWSGPTCQIENIALNKTTTSSDGYTFPPSNAVNGDTRGDHETRCILSAYNDPNIISAWWRVDLGQKTLIRDVIIYFRINYKARRNGIQVYIANTDNSSTDGANCYNVTGNENGTDIPGVLTANCSGEGRYLVLYTTTVNNDGVFRIPIMDFCEVEVNVCGPGTFGTNCSNYCHCEGKPCNSVNGVCPCGVCRPGWKMDKCDTACDGGSYGTNCTQTCSNRNCKSGNSSCNHMTGKCLGGCEAGWAGTDCTQECVHSYGEGCARLCYSRNCSGTSSCNHVTGQCENGCRPGWKNIDCTVACVQGLEYSAGCGRNCSVRMCEGGTDTCPRDTGRCESGCQSGWKGEDCTTVCSRGTHGANCTGKCGQCRDAKACHHVNGTCPSGCIDGWTGHYCKQETKNNNPPLIHSISLVIGLVVGVVITLLLGGAVHLPAQERKFGMDAWQCEGWRQKGYS